MRVLTALPFAFLVTLAAGACSSNGSSGNGDQSPTQPSSCPSPCTPGALCYQPDPNSDCNGDWYCWSDSLWHCAPPDSGGPGDATVDLDSGGGAEGGDEEPTPMGDAEAGGGSG